MTTRDLLNELLNNDAEEKILSTALENSKKNTCDRIQGNKNDAEWEKEDENIKKNAQQELIRAKLAKMQADQKNNEAIKAAQGVKVGSNNTSSGVSTQVQKPV